MNTIDKADKDLRNAMLNAVKALTIANQELTKALNSLTTKAKARPKLRIVSKTS